MTRGRTQRTLLAATVLPVVLGLGCTMRYSQTLVGEIRRVDMTTPIQNADGGTAFGPYPNLVFVLKEPRSAVELATLPCDVPLAQVDYRAKWFGVPLFYFYPSASFPEVTLTSYCVR